MEHKKFIGLNDDIIKIRTSVFVDEQGFKDEFDQIDKTCTHIVLYDNEMPIATCRYFKEGEIYHIGRVAIIKEYRGKHLGNKIMQIAETEIKNEGGKIIEVSAQVRVSEFYEKLGYNKIGDIYFDEYCEHIRMVKNL
ncbi:GNAT family N-acetyltransferase [bacterium]|nr:GNAT family N-acetyltransferase [bacterium]